MEKWEYLTEFIEADIDAEGVRKALEKKLPDLTKTELPRHAPQAAIPRLDQLGEQGWELVHMEPVYAQKNADVLISAGAVGYWTHLYFCVFKRPKPR
jgi:hypothetical protein